MAVALTGDRPTGPLHLGHYVGSLLGRIALQHKYDQYIMIADVQALTDNFKDTTKITKHVYDVALDYLSVGILPENNTIFIQSQIPQITELTLYYMNLVTLSRLERNPTIKHEIKQKKFGASVPVGFFCYPINQAADITIFGGSVVPVGEDQLPIIEQTNEIVRKFNSIYGEGCMQEASAYVSDTPRLVGIDGESKASKSLNNAIFLSDPSDVVRKKVFAMFTDPNHIHVSDPGKVEGNVVFTYLDTFMQDKEELEDMKTHYRKGGLGDVVIKKKLFSILEETLEPIRTRRTSFKRSDVEEILHTGCKRAYETAEKTMEKVRKAIGINYFNSVK